MPRWAWIVPVAAAGLLAAAVLFPPGTAVLWACAPALIAAVIASVHHAEVVAHRVGEPFGTLVLAVSITVIEVALIVSVMLAGGPDRPARPLRPTHGAPRPLRRPAQTPTLWPTRICECDQTCVPLHSLRFS